MQSKQTDSGVSPVIGVILLVAVAVALVSLVSVIAFDIGGNVQESPEISVQVEQTNNGINLTVLRNDNVDELNLTSDGNTDNINDPSPGDTLSLQKSSLPTTGTANVIARTAGNEEVIQIKEYSFG